VVGDRTKPGCGTWRDLGWHGSALETYCGPNELDNSCCSELSGRCWLYVNRHFKERSHGETIDRGEVGSIRSEFGLHQTVRRRIRGRR
jgi:hypothetical protein